MQQKHQHKCQSKGGEAMSSIERRIEAVVDTILQDYQGGRDIDRMEQFTQPDKDVIIDLIEKLRKIVCPGYFREKNYRIYNAKHNLSMLIEDVMYNLNKQIAIVLRTQMEEVEAAEKAQEISLAFFRAIPEVRAIARPMWRLSTQATLRLSAWMRSSSAIPACLPLRFTVLLMCSTPLMYPCCPES